MRQLPRSNSYLNCFLARLAILHAYIKVTTQLHIPFKKHHRAFLCNFLRKLKTSQDQRLGSQNPGHKPCDPGHSSNIFCLDSLWPYTSHPLYRIQLGVTERFPKIQQRNHHGPKSIPRNGIINWNACSNNQNIPRQNIYQQMIFFLINYCFQRFHFFEKKSKNLTKWIGVKIQKCLLKFKQLFPSKLHSGWREKTFSKVHNKSKYNSQNKMSNQKKKSWQPKTCKKSSEKMFILITVLFLGNVSSSSFSFLSFLFRKLLLFFLMLSVLVSPPRPTFSILFSFHYNNFHIHIYIFFFCAIAHSLRSFFTDNLR